MDHVTLGFLITFKTLGWHVTLLTFGWCFKVYSHLCGAVHLDNRLYHFLVKTSFYKVLNFPLLHGSGTTVISLWIWLQGGKFQMTGYHIINTLAILSAVF